MAERKVAIYYESSPEIDEDALFEHIHRFFCENPNEPTTQNCPLYAMTFQNVVE
ncbi:hypothetical protein SEA_FAUST_109 [Streptomyces phage Faust]|uniref:Uncharacterized protein n=1 Tax=Streptomyces phage Faust TaxID=2767565 RepID=A0A7G9UYU9_9CAUD|nr:hypothetical protein PP456_gp155 [Streptomyces phage Faust]QNN99204.1 hypothetical protein SEA_FAUST_109 [Streptomyces phage Faust]